MFDSLTVKNLFSWKLLEYQFSSGISQITGWNYDDNTPEGSGKSSILNSLSWTLFGKIPKEGVKIQDVVREGTKKAFGGVTLTNGYSIIRSRGPNDVYITSPEGKVIRGKDAKETQTIIEGDILGLDFDAFCQAIYFSQNYSKKFITSSETEKAKILSNIKDLGIFDRAKDSAHKQKRLFEEELRTYNLDKTKIEGKIETLRSNIHIIVNFIDNFNNTKEATLAKLNSDLDALENELQDLSQLSMPKEEDLISASQQIKHLKTALLNKQTELQVYFREIENKRQNKVRNDQRISRLEAGLATLEKKISKLNEADAAALCPTCGSTLNEQGAQHLQEEMKAAETELEHYSSEIEFIKTEQESYKISDEELQKNQKLAQEVRDEAERLNADEAEILKQYADIKQFEERVKSLCNAQDRIKAQIDVENNKNMDEKIKEVEILDSELTKHQEILKKLDADIASIQDKINRFEVLKKGFKEVKAYAFQNLLKDLSIKATNYASELFEQPISIDFTNEDVDGNISKIFVKVTLDGQERPLGLYSGGQSRRIQLAVDLALAQIVGHRSKNPINIRILDEPMKDLSVESMEKVVKLLENLKGTTVIIEHNPIIKSIVDKTFHVELKNGVSHHAI